jgi:hypothetical protein
MRRSRTRRRWTSSCGSIDEVRPLVCPAIGRETRSVGTLGVGLDPPDGFAHLTLYHRRAVRHRGETKQVEARLRVHVYQQVDVATGPRLVPRLRADDVQRGDATCAEARLELAEPSDQVGERYDRRRRRLCLDLAA